MGIGVHGQTPIERYRMPDLWSLHFYRYAARLELDGQEYALTPGCVSIVPPDTPMIYRYEGRSVHLYAHFRLVSSSMGSAMLVRPVQDLGDDFVRLYEQMEQVATVPEVPIERAQARLWDILWQLAERGGAEADEPMEAHPAVRRAVQIIDRRLAEPLSVEKIAFECGVSYSYLARLFTAWQGTSVIGYIGSRRMERARHLLLHSTLPVKAIAATVGIPDLHAFNKCVHRAFGASPRKLRQATSVHEDNS
jgi:AraC-like DNA-binding protein